MAAESRKGLVWVIKCVRLGRARTSSADSEGVLSRKVKRSRDPLS